jgi:hypothetical protein
LGETIFEIHGFLAALAHQPRLQVSEEESRKLAKAVADVGKHLPNLPAVKPHHAAIAALVWTAGRIYVPMARDILTSSPSPAMGHNGGPPLDVVVNGYSEPAPAAPAAPGQWFNLDGSLPN